jgi:hypothetical protein
MLLVAPRPPTKYLNFIFLAERALKKLEEGFVGSRVVVGTTNKVARVENTKIFKDSSNNFLEGFWGK